MLGDFTEMSIYYEEDGMDISRMGPEEGRGEFVALMAVGYDVGRFCVDKICCESKSLESNKNSSFLNFFML